MQTFLAIELQASGVDVNSQLLVNIVDLASSSLAPLEEG
jgi:hypothetical protein